MKKIWKWILGILIVLAVVAVLVAVPLVVMRTNPVAARGWNNGPMMPGNQLQPGQAPSGRNFQHPQVPGFEGQGGRMMGGGRGFNRGFSPFGFGAMFIGGLLRLIPLVLLGLLLFGVYQLGKRAGKRSSLATVAAPAQPAPAPTQPDANIAAENNQPPVA